MNKQELIEHCERQLERYKPDTKHFIEHWIFLRLLKGESVNDLFYADGRYIYSDFDF